MYDLSTAIPWNFREQYILYVLVGSARLSGKLYREGERATVEDCSFQEDLEAAVRVCQW